MLFIPNAVSSYLKVFIKNGFNVPALTRTNPFAKLSKRHYLANGKSLRMTTDLLINYLKLGLDKQFTFTQRYVFVQIDTNIITAEGKAISVFVTNCLPERVIVSDSSWIAQNTYFHSNLINIETKKEILKKWNIQALYEESNVLFHVHRSKELSNIFISINELIQCIVELSHAVKEVE